MLKRLLPLLFFSILTQFAYTQCFEVLDGNGVFTDDPDFVSCTPGNYTIFIQPDQNIGPYVIDWGDGSANSTGASLTVGTNISHTYTATTDTFAVTITDNGQACSITGTVIMERNPLASIQLPAGDDNFGCTPVQFRFINSSTQISGTTTFEWDFGDGSPVENYDSSNLGDTVLHVYLPGVGVQSCELEVTLTATNNCGTSTASFFPLEVWDLDEAQITPSAALLCYPDTIVQYTNNTIRNCFPEGNASQRYERWNFGDYWGLGYDSIIDWRPWNPPITPPPPIGYPGIGIYNVTLQDSSFCGIDDITIQIEITPPPTSIIAANRDTICEGDDVTFSNNSIGGANEFLWDFDQGSGFQTLNGNNKNRTYNTTGDYTIELIVGIAGAAGCRDTSSVDLHVVPTPSASFTFDNNNQCDSMTVNFTNTSTGTIAVYTWDFDNGNTFNGPNPPAQDFPSPGTYRVELTVENGRGCTNIFSQNVRVRETPSAGFTVSSVCLNQLANFIDQSTSPIDPVTDYKWYFGDGDSSTAQDPSHLYTAFGNYTVTQIVDNGFCMDTTTLMVTVENEPTAAFTVDTAQGCSRLTVNFTNASSVNAATFRWNFGDGSAIVTARDTFHTFTNVSAADTNFVVSLIALTAFGCADTTFDTITVFPVPIPSFTSDATIDCGPVIVNFTNTTVGDSLNFFWDFGDGTAIVNDTNPTHTFDNQTLFINNYEVQLIVLSNTGCTDTTSQTVTIYPEPIFTFSADPDSGCSPLVVRFPSVVGAVDYQWDFGDGNLASGPTPTHVFVNNTTNNQTYTIRLVAQNSFGCRDTTFGQVLVFPNPTSIFSLDTNLGCQPLPVSITNNSTGATTFNWDFGDGTTSDTTDASFIKTFTNNSALTTFNTIQLITETTDGCRDTSSTTVQIHPFIQASFLSDTVGCSPYPLSFNNQSQGAANYQWTFGDGASSPSTNPNYTYNNLTNSNQTYLAKLIANSPQGCIDSAEQLILVYPKPTAIYTVSESTGCHPLTVTFTNSSLLADSCAWVFGDGNVFNTCTPTVDNPYTNTTSFFPIDYASRLIVVTNNGCSDTTAETITVNPQIIADFSSDTAGCSPLSVRFQNQSSGGLNYEWTYGDGGNSFNFNSSNIYTNPTLQDSIYTVKLLATSQYGCVDSIEKGIEVFAKPVADFSTDLTSGCHPLPVSFTNNSQIADSCRWNFGDGSAIIDSCFNSMIKTYSNTISSVPINRNAQLFVYTNNGCNDTTDESITINPDINADFDSVPSGCHPLAVDFRNQSTGAQNFEWFYGDGGGSPQRNPDYTFVNFGLRDTIFSIKLRTTSSFGCIDSVEQDITIFPKPTSDFDMDFSDNCQPIEVEFTNNSSLTDSCSWIYGDGNQLSDCSPTTFHTYFNTLSLIPINLNPELIIVTNQGCADTLSRNITINPEITADFTGTDTACSPLDATFRSQSFGAVAYRWQYGDGRQGNGMVTSNRYTNTGSIDINFPVQLIAESLYGCNDTIIKNVLVRPTPIPDFTGTPQTQIFPSNTVTLTNMTNAGNWAYSWDFDDTTGSTLRDPAPKIYDRWGFFNIKLVAASPFCSDSISQFFEIEPPFPIADFGDSVSGCQPLEVTFTNRSIYGLTYKWDFGDGGRSNSENPTHIYFNEGVYSVTLEVTGFEPNKQDVITKRDYIEVYKTPSADFITNKDEVFVPNDPLVFSNRSFNADNYVWHFGDGNTSTEESPTYFYTEPGEYDVFLVASSANGCVDTAFAPNTVIAELEGKIIVPNAFTPNTRGPNGGRVNVNPALGEFNDVFYAKVSGTVKYELNIFNKWGELLFVSKDINVGWDGYYKNELSKQDVYVWKIKAEFADGTATVKVGDLMLLR